MNNVFAGLCLCLCGRDKLREFEPRFARSKAFSPLLRRLNCFLPKVEAASNSNFECLKIERLASRSTRVAIPRLSNRVPGSSARLSADKYRLSSMLLSASALPHTSRDIPKLFSIERSHCFLSQSPSWQTDRSPKVR
jgi:hypothetical protein